MDNKKCKICRRLGTKIFLKGKRCLSSKCAMVKSPYPPGEKRKKRGGGFSEYAKELAEKQKVKNWYNLREKQLSNYVKEIIKKRSSSQDAPTLLIQKLEMRLDNVIFRLGFSESRKQARQIVGHGHFLVNGRKVDVPSCQVKKGDVVFLKPSSLAKPFFKAISPGLKKHQAPSWISFNPDKLEAKITGLPSLDEAALGAELSAVFEFYSK